MWTGSGRSRIPPNECHCVCQRGYPSCLQSDSKLMSILSRTLNDVRPLSTPLWYSERLEDKKNLKGMHCACSIDANSGGHSAMGGLG